MLFHASLGSATKHSTKLSLACAEAVDFVEKFFRLLFLQARVVTKVAIPVPLAIQLTRKAVELAITNIVELLLFRCSCQNSES